MTAGERPGEPGREEEVMESKEFEEKMAGLLRERFGETAQISVQDVLKNNGITRRGISVITEGERFTPVLYLDTAYERYLAGETAGEIFEGLMEHNDSQIREMETEWDFQPEQFADYSHVKEYLRLRLVNYGKNTELLRDMPYVRWNDLVVIFYYEIGDGQAQIQISNRHLVLWGKTAETLYRDAMENMKNSVPDEMFPLSDLIRRNVPFWMGEEPPIHVLTNSTGRYGAAAMLYTGKIRELADSTGTDLVILPSSLHEVLIVPDLEEKRQTYRETVGEVNRTVLEPEEVLSDNIYLYSREKDAVELLGAA